MIQQSHCWAYTLRKPEGKETRVPQCSSQPPPKADVCIYNSHMRALSSETLSDFPKVP